MAMPQRDNTIEAIKRLEPPSRVRYDASGALLEYAVMHGEESVVERTREEDLVKKCGVRHSKRGGL